MRAFTLTELLIVIALIVLLLALAVPAFNFISGGRSVDAGQNVVSAMLGRARARAIESERYAGVAFYLDPVTGKTTMTMVVQRDGDLVGGEDPYANYKGWKVGATYLQGQEVIAVVADGTPGSNFATPTNPQATENRLIVRKYTAIPASHVATQANRPPDPATWGLAAQKFVDFDIDAESETVPVGVGVQLVNDTKGGTANTDRYVRTGVILFDGRGRLDSIPYAIRQGGSWGKRLLLTADIDPVAPAALYSQIGVSLYDLSAFKDAGYSENDTFFLIPSYGPAAGANETAPLPLPNLSEEDWLDKNSLLLSINRYNGTLVRGE